MSVDPNTRAVPLATQVGGHAGVLTSEDGSLLIKPCLPREKEFYEKFSNEPELAELRQFVPKFYGTLKAMPAEGVATSAESEKESLVLENLSFRMKKPNILDIKLGTILWDETANEDKRLRMEKTARETTSLETGVRLVGFQVYNNITGEHESTEKAYGKGLKAEQLPEGIAKFFPSQEQGGPNAPLLIETLREILDEVQSIESTLRPLEMRIVGGSILILYEGQETSLKEALEAPLPEPTDDNASDSESSGLDSSKMGAAFVVKLIDFAHTRLVPGEGPDEGVLLGLRTTIKLIEGRIKELQESIA